MGGGGGIPVEGSGAVEEFEVEGGSGLAVDFSAGIGLHGHCGWGGRRVFLRGGVGFAVWCYDWDDCFPLLEFDYRKKEGEKWTRWR